MKKPLRRLLSLLVPLLLLSCVVFSENENAEETIVLLHGMGRTRASMSILSTRLRNQNYKVLSFSYNEANTSLDEISANLKIYISDNVDTPRYHLVAHSLGNIVIRNGFHSDYPEGLGRIVMLAPPNHPSQLAKAFNNVWLYKFITGDSGQKLSQNNFYKKLPIPNVEFGIIAGTKGQSFTFSSPNDGIVKLKNTKLDGMKDWISLNHSHTFIMSASDSCEQIIFFLNHGQFYRNN